MVTTRKSGRSAATQKRGDGPIKVLIVGGGCAGLSAAWQLAKLPGFEIEVVESRLHLGGKGASTRDDQGRVLEHGLHVWLGFYENAFAMMRECYDTVEQHGWGPVADFGKRLPHGALGDAFFADPNIGVAGYRADSGWEVWSGVLPPAPGHALPAAPGSGVTSPSRFCAMKKRSWNVRL